mgnify:CR=1 FL=1
MKVKLGDIIQQKTLWSKRNYLTWQLRYLFKNVLLTHFWIGKLSARKSIFVWKSLKNQKDRPKDDPKDDPQDLDENLQDIALHSNVQDGKFKDKVNKDTTKIHLCTICKEFKSNNLYIFGRHKKSCEKKFEKMWGFPNNSTEDPGERDEIIKILTAN